jgi:hypothetical protein
MKARKIYSPAADFELARARAPRIIPEFVHDAQNS